jgi:hypothetical protein
MTNNPKSLQTLAAKAIARCFKYGRLDCYADLLQIPYPHPLVLKVIRFVIFARWEWYQFSEQQRVKPTWDPYGSPLRKRVRFYRRRYGRIDDFGYYYD